MRKTFLITILFLFVISLAGCGENNKNNNLPTPTPTASIKTLKEGEGPQVSLIPSGNKQSVSLKIASISADIKKIDYEIVYDTNGVQRGVLGSLDVKAGQDKIVKEILLASCSKNVCVYDKNVTKLQLTMKFTGDLEPLEFQKDYPL